ncbi:hypothetical protein D3C78_1808210 [compost metagenome]
MQGFAQRTPADAMDTRKLGLGNLAAGGDLALDDSGLDLLENMIRQRFAIARRSARQGQHFAHSVNNLSDFWGCDRVKAL